MTLSMYDDSAFECCAVGPVDFRRPDDGSGFDTDLRRGNLLRDGLLLFVIAREGNTFSSSMTMISGMGWLESFLDCIVGLP